MYAHETGHASLRDCVSEEERKQRFGVVLVNIVIWALIVVAIAASMGTVLLFAIPGWLIAQLLAEYNVRKLQAIGATVSASQLPVVHQAALDVTALFGLKVSPRVIVLGSGESNALSLRIARKRVVIILSELLEGIVDEPEQLRFLLAHEICHSVLDHGARGYFEIYMPARYKAARELTCDNAGVVAAGDPEAGVAVITKLCVGYRLHSRVSEAGLKEESEQIYSGFSGWLLRRHLTHPPAGARLAHIRNFAARRLPKQKLATHAAD